MITQSEVIENYGKCAECNKQGILGDGLCVRCWDEKVQKAEVKKQPYQVARLSEKFHYVFWEDGDYLMRVCAPQAKGIPRAIMREYHYNPFRKGYPTCLKCLGILKTYRRLSIQTLTTHTPHSKPLSL